MQIIQSRRSFLTGLSATGVASTLSLPYASATELPAPETTIIRFSDFPESTCTVPQFIAGELLLQDGFSEVIQVSTGDSTTSLSMFENDEIETGAGGSPSDAHQCCHSCILSSRDL